MMQILTSNKRNGTYCPNRLNISLRVLCALLAMQTAGIPATDVATEAEASNASSPVRAAASAYALGLKYFKGDGVEKNDKEAYRLIREAGEAGNGDALGVTGYFYSVGFVVEKDDAEARRYFEKGAEKGSRESMVNLGRFLIAGKGGARDVERGIGLIEKTIAGGSEGARLILGEIYYFGEHSDGTPDYEKAYEVLIVSAEGGDARAQNMIGVMARDGQLGPPDAVAARGWFEKAAVQGDPKACSNLGHLLGHNSSEKPVRIEALKWLFVARELKETTAAYTIGDMRWTLSKEEADEAQELAKEVLGSFGKQ